MEGDQPRVRGLLMWFADESGFYFHTGTPKNVCKQLKKNPKLEVCFMAHSQNPAEMKMMRLAGKMKFIEDLKPK
jgi:pyridoxamine 5'-phosphate oxidase